MKTNNISIFFSCDDNYIPFFAVSLSSLIKNASKDYHYDIRVLHSNGISKENQDRLISKFSSDVFNLEFVNIVDYVEKINNKLHTRDYYSKSTYFRLFIPNLYPEIDKALYLDSDITVLGDISELYNTDLGDNFVGAIGDEAVSLVPEFADYVEKKIGVDTFENYFNAGILLMNLKKLREIDFENVFINLLTAVYFNVAQDQDYLNVICRNRVKLIDRVWNKMPFPSQINEGDIKLIHYNLSFKPWHCDNILYENYFWDYTKDCGFYDEIRYVKDNYDQSLIELANKQTEDLKNIAKAQAEDIETNKKIENILRSICLFNI